MHSTTAFARATQGLRALLQRNAHASSPVALDPDQLRQVSGGLPKGGWQNSEDFGEVLDVVTLPKGGWL